MERKAIILIAVFGTVGGLAVLAVLGLAAWLFLRAKQKSKQRSEDFEHQDDHGDGYSVDRNGKLTKKNGFLSLKTPLISTKAFG